MNSREAANMRRRWRHWIKRLKPPLTDLVVGDHIYHEMRATLAANPDIQKPGTLHGWMVNDYVDSAAVGIRRMCDQDRRSLSLWHLLRDIADHSEAVTRASYVHGFPPEGKRSGHSQFDRHAGRGSAHLPRSEVLADLRALEASDKPVRLLVNKRIAHLDKRNTRRKWPAFKDLGDAISLMERLLLKYQLILTGSHQVTLLPSKIEHGFWKAILRKPWIR